MKKIYFVTLVLVLFACLIGNFSGYLIGLYSSESLVNLINDAFETEKYADITVPQTFNNKSFKINYPSNWKIDTESDVYDPETNIIFDSPGSSNITIIKFTNSAYKEEELIEDYSSVYDNLFDKIHSNTEFSDWGNFKGKGKEVRGSYIGINVKVRLFVITNYDDSYLIVEYITEDDYKFTEKGFQLIRSSFKFV